MKRKLLNILYWLFCLNATCHAQQAVDSGGGNATGTGGTAAYSVGQAIYTTAVGAGGSATQGIEQVFIASSTLPINFLSFTSKCIDGKTKLNWATSFEQNNAFFEVEKSENGRKWFQIAKLKGGINTKETQKYEVVDETATKQNYYRIKQIDFDGKFTYSNVLYVMSCQDELQSISIYPNPTVRGINITVGNAKNTYYEIVDMAGKVLEKNALNTQNYVFLEKQTQAMYFLRITNSKNEVKIFKIIKN